MLIRTMAKLSLLLCLTVLGVLFLFSGAHGTDATMFRLGWDAATRGHGAPQTAGSALTLGFLVFGFSVLTIGVVAPRPAIEANEAELFVVHLG